MVAIQKIKLMNSLVARDHMIRQRHKRKRKRRRFIVLR